MAKGLAWVNSKTLLLLIAISVTWVNFNQERWLKMEVISDDVAHYYSYLPAFFYEKDLKLQFLYDNENIEQEKKYYAPNYTETNQPIIKMAMGQAFGYLPFFAAAHVTAKLAHQKCDGFSSPYQFAIQFSSLIYYLFGIFILSRLLCRYFHEPLVAVVLFAITFGTNVFYYLTIRAGHVHTFDFFLVSAFLYSCETWRDGSTFKPAAGSGFLLGLMTITRPVNLLFILIPLLMNKGKEIASPIEWFLKKKNRLLVAALIFGLTVLPQLLYWHHATGSFIYNSYIGERFYFDRPHLVDGLFSFRKGWLIYTPMMILPLIGLFMLKNKVNSYRWPLWIFIPLYLYVTFSWWCWWYGGSFGQRALIDIYPLLSIPFCALLNSLLSKPLKVLVTISMAGLIALNLFQTMQAKYNIIHYDAMTWRSYKRFFLISTGIPDREEYLLHPDYEKALRGEDEYPAESRIPPKN